MANVRAFRSGNWSDTNPATSPWGTGGVLYAPAPEDDVYANSFTVTVNTSPTVVSVRTGAATSLLWKDGATANATAGGGFTLNNGVTLTANVFAGSTTACTLNSGSATITGNCTSGSSYGAFSAYNLSTGTLTINGNVTGGTGDTANGCQNQTSGTITINGNVAASGSSNNGSGAVNNAGGIINITGNVLGAAFGGRGVFNTSSGRINISGNVTGGSNASNAHGAVNFSTGRIVITNGTVTGGSNSAAYGVHNASTGVIEITGVVNGASSGAPGVRNESTGTVLLTGTATGGSNSAGYGVHNFGNGVVTITGLAAGGSAATGARNEAAGIINLTRAVGNGFGFGSVGLSAAAGVTNVSVTGEIVLQEIEYGVLGMTPTSGSRIKLLPQGTNQAKFNFTSTGTTKTLVDASTTGDMPAASNVRSGTTYALGTLTGTCAVPPAGSVALGVPVDNTTGTAVLTGADVQSALTAQGLTSVRASNLDNLDATVSSRLAPSGTLATVTNLTNAPASVTPADIWSHASRTITGGVVDTLTNAPSVPSAATIASQVRTELSVELARVDQNISSRLAASAYTAPANSDIAAIKSKTDALPASPAATGDIPSANIAAIKAKTDLLNTDRLAQVSTVSTTGAQLAAALS